MASRFRGLTANSGHDSCSGVSDYTITCQGENVLSVNVPDLPGVMDLSLVDVDCSKFTSSLSSVAQLFADVKSLVSKL